MDHDQNTLEILAKRFDVPNPDEKMIRKQIEDLASAVRRKDVESILAIYTPEAVLFLARNALEQSNKALFRRYWQDYFSGVNEFGYEIRDLKINLEGTFAFATSLIHTKGLTKQGDRIEHWLRVTQCFKLSKNIWKICHEHNSVPGDFENGRILTIGPGIDVKH